MVCIECGAVASENAVTASVEYVENAGGTSTAIGRFVSDESKFSVMASRAIAFLQCNLIPKKQFNFNKYIEHH